MTYESFLQSKQIVDRPSEFTPTSFRAPLFAFQRDIVQWAVKRGRSHLGEDCGLGKTIQELEWAEQVAAHTGKPVLLVAPLAVAQQTAREGSKFGIAVNLCRQQSDMKPGVNVTNYDKMDHFPDASKIGGLVLDESSILKAHDGKFRQRITQFGQQIAYRLTASATAAPNDFMELGTHAEFLGVMTLPEMLATFFVHDGGDTSKWRLKGHAEDKFWEWVASWAVCIRKPSDLGYEDGGFVLPPLKMHQHTVECEAPTGYLFPVEGQTLQERGQARKDSVAQRVGKCADLVNGSSEQWLVWCNLNSESEALAKSIPGAVEIRGSDDAGRKEQAAIDFVDGRSRVLISKPSIFGFGLNFQQCSHMGFVGLSDSYEQFYQAVRRCWRFGQKNEVHAHVIAAETEGAVVRNIERKERQAQEMFDGMVRHMAAINEREIRGTERQRDRYEATKRIEIPTWLRTAS